MKVTVGVLRGGPSQEYDVSLKSGAAVLRALDPEKYHARDIFIDKAGRWHRAGVASLPTQALVGVDVVFNALHGEYGEDGTVQRTLDVLGVPYTGSGAFASATAFNKEAAKQAVREIGIRTPHSVTIDRSEVGDDLERFALELFRTFPLPIIIKPRNGGSSHGIMVVTHFNALLEALRYALAISPSVIVEEYIRGREATVGVIDGFRGEPLYALLPIEIVLKDRPVYDREAKYADTSDVERHSPGKFGGQDKYELMDLARRIHKHLDLSHYSRSDFIVTKRGIYFLEVNTLPGLTEHSLLPLSLDSVGSSLSDFLDHVIEEARKQ
ncbi:MAG TPA: D-alanine--D-alanine ligase [Candidatus Paceibacterota bacterium]